MAQQTIVQFVDDITGDVADETVRFGLDRVTYEIDLAAANAARLREVVAPFVQAARRVRPAAAAAAQVRSARADREQTRAIRDWARANGHQVADRGRIPSEVAALFEAAH